MGGEWKRGWRIVVGAMVGSGFGMPLFYYVASIFTIPMTTEFGASRGEMANVQALLVVGALVAPYIGRLLDMHGFAWIFGICTGLVVIAHLLMASVISSLWAFAVIAFIYGAAGIGCGPVAYTRPINAWFSANRGLALGLAAIGAAVTTMFGSPMLAYLVENQGWRAGYLALALLAGLIALPVALLLVRDAPPEGIVKAGTVSDVPINRSFYSERDFWLLAASILFMSIPGAGLLSQISPLVQAEGIGPAAAAWAISAYAIGQFIGRIVAGWCLDRRNPRAVAMFFTLVPSLGFVLLWSMDLSLWLAVIAVGLVGIQQGAEIDLFAFFTARRFGVERYGAVYGSIIASAWIGNAVGILTFGWLFTLFGSYTVPEIIAAGLLGIGALLLGAVQIDPPGVAASPQPR
jgi:MFS family permease